MIIHNNCGALHKKCSCIVILLVYDSYLLTFFFFLYITSCPPAILCFTVLRVLRVLETAETLKLGFITRSIYDRANSCCFFADLALTPEGFRFSPTIGVIVIGCVASVVSIACIIVVALSIQRKRSRRRRRERSGDESKTAIGGSGGGGTGTGTGAGNGADSGNVGGGTDVGAGGGADHLVRTDAVDDGLEKNPDIIPHDNGK